MQPGSPVPPLGPPSLSQPLESPARLTCQDLFRQCPHNLGGNVQEKDRGDERDGEDDDDEWVTDGCQ